MKKGFTLVELLAVVILLGIVAFLTVRSVSQSVRNAKSDVADINEESYIRFVNDALLNGVDTVNNGTYPIMSNGNVCIGSLSGKTCNGSVLDLKLSGSRPIKGTVTIKDYEVTSYTITETGKGD